MLYGLAILLAISLIISIVAILSTAWRQKMAWLMPFVAYLAIVVFCLMAGFFIGLAVAESITCSGWLCSIGYLIKATAAGLVAGLLIATVFVVKKRSMLLRLGATSRLLWAICAIVMLIGLVAIFWLLD